MSISDRWGAMAMVWGSSCGVSSGGCRYLPGGCCFLLDVTVAPTPSPAERCLTACLLIQRPGGVKSRLTTICCGWPLPETRDAVSLQHCSYVLVNHLRAPFLLVTGRSRLLARQACPGTPDRR